MTIDDLRSAMIDGAAAAGSILGVARRRCRFRRRRRLARSAQAMVLASAGMGQDKGQSDIVAT
jgi:hypothetical protein